MTDYRDGHNYIWNGGECPVHPKDRVLVWFGGFRDWSDRVECLAEELDWRHPRGSDNHIVAFQVSRRCPDDPRDAVIRRLVEALEPLAVMAEHYDPDEGDDGHLECWSGLAVPKIHNLRAARAALTFAKEQLK